METVTILIIAITLTIVAIGLFIRSCRYTNDEETKRVLELKKYYEEAAKSNPDDKKESVD